MRKHTDKQCSHIMQSNVNARIAMHVCTFETVLQDGGEVTLCLLKYCYSRRGG